MYQDEDYDSWLIHKTLVSVFLDSDAGVRHPVPLKYFLCVTVVISV